MTDRLDPRHEAQARVDALEPGRYDARVLEPSPPAVTEPPWFADDPVAPPTQPSRTVVSPVSNASLTWDELARGDRELTAWCAERWLGGWRPLRPVPDRMRLTATREAWHTLAERLLAPTRYRATTKIGLRVTRHGFGTPFFRGSGGDEQLRVDGTSLVVARGEELRTPVTTLRAAADAVGIEPGAHTGLYDPTTPADPDAALRIDADAAAWLGDWLGFGASVLEELRAPAPDAPSTRLQLWPEHFDLSLDLGDAATGQRGTFGASPGDAGHPLPYLYVTHWAPVPDDGFWNDATFGGASLAAATLVDEPDQRDAALAFLRRGVATLRRR